MEISRNGIDFIKREEGETLIGYLDSRGIPTIGVGHIGEVKGYSVFVGMQISLKDSAELLRSDLSWVESAINNHVTSILSQNQYDALCSFVFNIGATAFKRSTMLTLLNLTDYLGAAQEFPKWKKAGNNPNILLPRRLRERSLFLS